MKIGFASADWSDSVVDEKGYPVMGGSGWARIGQYVDLIPHSTVVGVLSWKEKIFGVREWDGTFHFDCDIIVMQRNMFADIPEKLPIAKAEGQIIINDVDDWYWGLSQSNRAWYYSHPKVNPNENRVHYKKTVANSSGVTVSTPFLQQEISKWANCPVYLVKNHVELDKFGTHEQSQTDVPVVGWVGSTAHRSGDLEQLRNVLPILHSRREIKVHHSGHLEGFPTFAQRVNMDIADVSTTGMARPSEYPNILNFDIGLVPLNDVPFNHAKSYIKGLEYAAKGIPFIATPMQAYKELCEEYGIGRLAVKPKHWIAAIRALRSPEARIEEAKSNKEKMVAFSHIIGATKLTECLESFL